VQVSPSKKVGVYDSLELAVPDPNRKTAPLPAPASTIEDKQGIFGTQQDTLCGNNAAVYQRRKKRFQRAKRNEIFYFRYSFNRT
jgi:hypothetical protein